MSIAECFSGLVEVRYGGFPTGAIYEYELSFSAVELPPNSRPGLLWPEEVWVHRDLRCFEGGDCFVYCFMNNCSAAYMYMPVLSDRGGGSAGDAVAISYFLRSAFPELPAWTGDEETELEFNWRTTWDVHGWPGPDGLDDFATHVLLTFFQEESGCERRIEYRARFLPDGVDEVPGQRIQPTVARRCEPHPVEPLSE